MLIRPVRPSDAELLAEGFTRLSPESRRFRFLAGKPQLSADELRRLTDVDHRDHEAVGALDPRDGRGVGVARFVRCADDPAAAEVAVTVVDAWHGRGVGTALMRRLVARANEEGITRFVALIAADNYAVLALLRSVGGEMRLTEHDGQTLELSVELAPSAAAPGGRARWSLVRRWSARRAVAG
ncbi:MAG TPA: GNAT family N-acetyltransferase [Jatrophihabitans sp.]|nr:GNAT family N-acetyltransferase [Jatrophihabitans sp.]